MSFPKEMFRQLADTLRSGFLFRVYVVSYPKCGRMWLNTILLHCVLLVCERLESPLPFEWLPSMNRYAWHQRSPNICFMHDMVGAVKAVVKSHHAFYPSIANQMIRRELDGICGDA